MCGRCLRLERIIQQLRFDLAWSRTYAEEAPADRHGQRSEARERIAQAVAQGQLSLGPFLADITRPGKWVAPARGRLPLLMPLPKNRRRRRWDVRIILPSGQ